MNLRKFKLRNGLTVEEITREDTLYLNGYQDDYKVIEFVEGVEHSSVLEEWLCLSCKPEGYPVGGEHGTAFDIVEELT